MIGKHALACATSPMSANMAFLLKNRLDKVWSREDILYDYKAPAPTTRKNSEDLTIEA